MFVDGIKAEIDHLAGCDHRVRQREGFRSAQTAKDACHQQRANGRFVDLVRNIAAYDRFPRRVFERPAVALAHDCAAQLFLIHRCHRRSVRSRKSEARRVRRIALVPIAMAIGALGSHAIFPYLEKPARVALQPVAVVTGWEWSGIAAWLLYAATMTLGGIGYVSTLRALRR